MAFLAFHVQPCNAKFGGKDYNMDDLSMEKLKATMTDQEWIRIYEMSQDKNLFNNLTQSLFPMIYGKLTVDLLGVCNIHCFSPNVKFNMCLM